MSVLRFLTACVIAAAPSCVRDARDPQAARTQAQAEPSSLVAHSWGLCSLVGPRNQNPGVYGTDLGFTARRQHDDKLTMLFGDTWVEPASACHYPALTSDDFQAQLPVQRPARFMPGAPAQAAADSCNLLEYAYDKPDDVTSWRRVRLFPSPVAHSEDTVMDTSALRTPAAAFSDGRRMFVIYSRNDPTYCSHDGECPTDMRCTADSKPTFGAKPLGQCSAALSLTSDAAPSYCRDAKDCTAGTCEPLERGVCMAERPFRLQTAKGGVVPTWYRDDPRRAIAHTLYIAAAVWPDRPTDYAVLLRFPTNRFQNLVVRSVAYFDAAHPEKNDYRPGYHTLLVWGRASFVETGGAQALPFFSYVPMAELQNEPEAMRWQPRFFAGYDARGNPAWSEHEGDAQPIYGTEANVVDAGGEKIAWREPEFDYVEWATMSYVAPIKRWVMLYGGDLPAFMVLDPQTGRARDPVYRQFEPGAIHMRSAAHPWGRLHRGDARGWSSAEPILMRQTVAQYLACGSQTQQTLPGCLKNGDPHSPLDLMVTLAKSLGKSADITASCIGGEFAMGVQNALSGDKMGRLYAPNIIDDWTADVTPDARKANGPHSAEIYWNVSTWNPYQVIMVKSRIDEAR